jgi:IclR family transcriptional regulator, acetate operon repressor
MATRDRALAIIELLARFSEGLALSEVADELSLPRSATHRVLHDLKVNGYVRQSEAGGRYGLTVKLAALGLSYLASAGVTDLVQPILDQLAAATGELITLAVVEGDHLVRVAKAQGGKRGLVYNPSEGSEVYLAATANGHAWLACLSDERALELVAAQGFTSEGHGPAAPRTIKELLKFVHQARKQGYSMVSEIYEAGTSAIAAPIIHPVNKKPVGTLSIAGPTIRLDNKRMLQMASLLSSATAELAVSCLSSPIFQGSASIPKKQKLLDA